MPTPNRARLLTPAFRVSRPDVFVKRTFQGLPESSGRYACTALFSGFEVINGATSLLRAPTSWGDKDREKWHALIGACNETAIAAFKKPMEELLRIGGYRLPFRCGDEVKCEGYGPGVIYFTMSGKKRPGIITSDGVTPITQSDPQGFYAGCFARASVNPFANLQWKSLSIGLLNLQKLADGPRLDAFGLAAGDFATDPL